MANVIGSDTGGGASSTNTINSIPMPDLIPDTIYAPDGKTVLISKETQAGWGYDGDQKGDNSRTDKGGTNTGGKSGTKKKTTQTCKFVIKYNGQFGGVSYNSSYINEEEDYYGWMASINGGDPYPMQGKPPDPSSEAYSGKNQSVTLEIVIKENEGNFRNETSDFDPHVMFFGWKTSNGTVFVPGQKVTHTWSSGSSSTYTLTFVPVLEQDGYVLYHPDKYTNEEYYKWTAKSTTEELPLLGDGFSRVGATLVGWTFIDADTDYWEEHYSGRWNRNTAVDYYDDHNNRIYVLDDGSEVSDVIPLGDGMGPWPYDRNEDLYPFWLMNRYTIHYHIGETTLNYTTTFFYGDEYEIPSTGEMSIPEGLITGYTITSWNESPDGVGDAWIPGEAYTMARAEDLDFYAILEGNEYTVYYRDADTPQGEYIHSSKAVYGQPFYTDRLPVPEGKENISFNGWVADDNTVLTKSGAQYDAYTYGSDPTWSLTRDLVITRQWSPYYPFGKILFGGQYSDEFGVYVEKPPSSSWPEYDYKHDEVYGRHGDVLTDMRRYKNVSVEYDISAYDYADYKSVAKKVSEWLHRETNGEYLRLEDSYEPDVYRLAVYEESNTLENILAKAGKATITFNCKPQKFLLSGEKEIAIPSNAPYTLTNPTNHTSRPLIKIQGTGTFTINGKEITVFRNSSYILLDAEIDMAFNSDGYLMNECMYTEDTISLKPGDNVIDYSDSDIYKVSVTPRWWRI